MEKVAHSDENKLQIWRFGYQKQAAF